MEKLEEGGFVELWSGWAINLPRGYYQRNPDGSWSAWGEDWTIDITIIDVACDRNRQDITASQLLGAAAPSEIIVGSGWMGTRQIRSETDRGRPVLRVATKLCATNTVMSCWVSILDEDRLAFADKLIFSIVYKR